MAVNQPMSQRLTVGLVHRQKTYRPRRTMMKRILIALFGAAVLCLASTGCHTVHGAGEDISNAGQTIQNNTP